jgi:RecA/RadA recombinase
MSKFTKNFLSKIKDEYTSIVEDEESSAEFTGYIDTGSYILNAVFSGSLYGGIPNNKLTMFAGESATGKTFFVLGICKAFLDSHDEATVIYYDTEAAVTKAMMKERGIDVSRVIVSEPETIQKFRYKALQALDTYMEIKDSDKPPIMIVLDSLGMLSTSKELEDSTEGKDTRDMTKAQVIKATVRVLILKAAKARVPILVTNHTYDGMGMFATKEISGGSGLKFAATTIAMLSKKKEKEGTDVIGNIIHVKMYKSRLSKENSMVDVRLTYKEGLDKYYGLLDLAEKYNIIKKVSTRYELPDGTKVFGKEINSNPEKYFTEEVMTQLEEAAKKEFSYGI